VKGKLLQCTPQKCVGIGKGKFRPVTGHEGSEGEHSTLSLNSALNGVDG